MSRGYVVGVDVGTTAVKCVALPVGGGAPVRAVEPTPTRQPLPGRSEQRPADLCAAFDAALGSAVARLDGPVLAIGLSTAMHGLVGLDAAGRPATELATWADTRAQVQAQELRRDGIPDGSSAGDLHAQTGTPVHSMSPLTKLLWWRQHHPDTFERVRTWLDLKGLLLHHLTGRLVVDRSSASATGLLERGTGRWHGPALELTGIDAARLPEVVEPETVLELSAPAGERVGLPAGTPVVPGTSDGPAAMLGSGVVGPGVAGLSLGTSGAIRSCWRGTSPPAPPPGLFCYAMTGDRWAYGGAVSNGGNVLHWLTSVLLRGEHLLDGAAELAAGADGLVVLPYLWGERSPLWDPGLPGMVLGLRAHHTPEHVVRAAFEGISHQLAAVLRQLEQVQPVERVVATGGVLRHRWQLDTLAAVLEHPVAMGQGVDDAALGAAAVAWWGVGGAPGPEEARDLLAGQQDQAQGLVVEPEPDLVAAARRHPERVHDLLARARVAAEAVVGPAPGG